MLVNWKHNQGWYWGWQGNRLVVLLCKHDNCDSPEMRKKWSELFGFLQPFWRVRRSVFEVGLEVRGVLYTLIIE